MAPFPSPLERTVASALLLLSTKPPSPSNCGDFDGELMLREGSEEESESLSLVSSGGSKSKAKSRSSCCSVVTSDCNLAQKIRAHKLRIIAVVARCHELKLKVVKKSRSKVCWSSDHKKIIAVKPSKESSETEVSCLSTSSSAVSSARSRYETRSGKRPRVEPRKKRAGSNGSGSAHLSRRADAILKFLCGGCSSEVNIRHVIGDSPDTSKALRMLLKQEEVKRSGTGGRHDPYIYKIAQEGINELDLA